MASTTTISRPRPPRRCGPDACVCGWASFLTPQRIARSPRSNHLAAHQQRPAAEAKTSGSGSTRTPSGQNRLFTIAGVLGRLAPNARLLAARWTGGPPLQVPLHGGVVGIHCDRQHHSRPCRVGQHCPSLGSGRTGTGGFDASPPGALPGRRHASLPRQLPPLGVVAQLARGCRRVRGSSAAPARGIQGKGFKRPDGHV